MDQAIHNYGVKQSESFEARDGTLWFTWYFDGPLGQEYVTKKVYHAGHILEELRGMVELYTGTKGHEVLVSREKCDLLQCEGWS